MFTRYLTQCEKRLKKSSQSTPLLQKWACNCLQILHHDFLHWKLKLTHLFPLPLAYTLKKEFQYCHFFKPSPWQRLPIWHNSYSASPWSLWLLCLSLIIPICSALNSPARERHPISRERESSCHYPCCHVPKSFGTQL